MESSIKLRIPEAQLLDKDGYEPLLLESLNRIPFYIEKSGGGFFAPESESCGQCDAIGTNGSYDIDFKLLVSQEGAQNVIDTRLAEEILCEGVTSKVSSKASRRGQSSLPFPSIWGFLVTRSVYLNENNEIVLTDEADKHMKETIKSLNRMIRTKKNLLFFQPGRLEFHANPIEVLYKRANEALTIVSKARRALSSGYDTYYALMMNDKIVFLSENFIQVGCIELASLGTWQKLHPK